MNGYGYSLRGKRIYVAGHRGMVGSALLRALRADEHEAIVADHAELDLTNQADTLAFMTRTRPQVVLMAAARVGGILANDSDPVGFLYHNLMIAANVISAAHLVGVERLVFLGSSCVYPKMALQPITESALLSGPLEPTNQWYAVAKIAGIKLCEAYRRQFDDDYISVMPTNLYGPHDNFDLQTSHVLPAMLRRFHEAAQSRADQVVIWGTGTPRREFLHVDDLADACLFLTERYSGSEIVNIGCGEDISIRELAETIAEVVGFKGKIVHDLSKPDGTPRKLLDVSVMSGLGWSPRIKLSDGIAHTYAWFRRACSDPLAGLRL